MSIIMLKPPPKQFPSHQTVANEKIGRVIRKIIDNKHFSLHASQCSLADSQQQRGGLLRLDEEKLCLNTVLLVVAMTMTLLFIIESGPGKNHAEDKESLSIILARQSRGYGVKHPVRLGRNK